MIRFFSTISNPRKSFFGLLMAGVVFLTPSCGNRTSKTGSSPNQPQEGRLIVKNPVLEQFKENGLPVWKVTATQAQYRKNQEIAEVENPVGVLYQDGKVAFHVQAKQGEVQQDGKKIFLKNEIVATDIQSGAVLRGDELEWTPDQDILIVRKNLTGTHKQLDAYAKEGRVYSRKRQMELLGEAIAITKEEPILHLRTEKILWYIDQQLVKTPLPVLVDRYQEQKISDRAQGRESEVNLKTKTVTLKKNATVTLLNPTVEISSELITWNLDAEVVTSPEPVQVQHLDEKILFTGNSAKVEVGTQICTLTGDVQGYDTVKKSQLRSDSLTWFIKTENIDAVGNVIYRQTDPNFTVSGPKATGSLSNKTVTVLGAGGPVVTEIIPQTKN